MLAEAARITEEHGRRYAGRIPLQKADSRPHAGPNGASDYVQHAHLVSAPPDVDDQLNRKLAALLDQYRRSGAEPAVRAHDPDTLKRYWMTGDGAGKWATWTELYGHLKKHMADELAKRVAAEWFHERYGIWPGSDKNRVLHGKPPRGKVVGPG